MNPQNTEEQIKNLVESIEKDSSFAFLYQLTKEHPQAEVFLVGGIVRDILLGKENKDYDFLISGIKKNKLEQFLRKFGEVADIESRTFGVFKFKPHNWMGEFMDIALPREEKQIGLGYKDFDIKTSARLSTQDDLSRRDFTINAIAIKVIGPHFKEEFKLVDPFNGREDLKKGIIRAVGNPEKRFKEDPSRILRAVRFACQLGFQIEEKTFQAAQRLVSEIVRTFVDEDGEEKTRVSPEIIASEFLKGFDANPTKLLKLYDELGVLPLILPEVSALKGVEQPQEFHSEGDVWQHTLLVLNNLNPNTNINVKLAALFHDIGKPETQTLPRDKNDRIRFNEHDIKGAEIFCRIFDRLKLSSPFAKNHYLYPDKKEIFWLIKNHMFCVTKNPEAIRPSTIENYFLKKPQWGEDLLELSYADISATILSSGKPDFSTFEKLKQRIDEVRDFLEKEKEKEKLNQKNPPICNGREIMEIFNLAPGPLVGLIKETIRDLQLSRIINNKEDLIKNKEKILKSCQQASTVEEAIENFNKI